MGDVYLASHDEIERKAAVKILSPELSRNTEFSDRFKTEATAAAKLKHHNIVALYDYGIQDGIKYMAMQYIDGKCLEDIISEKSLGYDKVLKYSREICRALNYAHSHGVIHRDIKPQNIMIDRSDRAHVSDFGIAKILSSLSKKTSEGMVVGTPEYMSPEQAESTVLGPQTDLYSLGVLMYEMVCGEPPFKAESPLAVAYKQVNSEPDDLCEACPDIPKRLNLIIIKALKKDLSERYKSAEEMLHDLDSVKLEETQKKTRKIFRRKNHSPGHDWRIVDRRSNKERRKTERRSVSSGNTAIIALLAIVAALLIINIILKFR